MELKFTIINAREIEDGDMFYCTPDFDLNEFGPHYILTGTDQIFIKDDYVDEDEIGNYGIMVNGGHEVWFEPGAKVVRIGHYRDLVRVIEMVQEGNPEMNLGPSDANTIIDRLRAERPDLDIGNPLDNFLNRKRDENGDIEDHKDYDPDLPF